MNTSSPQVVTAVIPSSSLEWTVATLCDGIAVNHATAAAACAALGEGWRLPTRIELLTLVDDSRIGPAIDTNLFPDPVGGSYWTRTPHAAGTRDAWIVEFFGGSSGNYRKEGNFAFVRAVRTVSPAEGESE